MATSVRLNLIDFYQELHSHVRTTQIPPSIRRTVNAAVKGFAEDPIRPF